MWYSSESTKRELSNGYQHDRVYMVFKGFSVLVLWMKVALEGLRSDFLSHMQIILTVILKFVISLALPLRITV